MKVAEGANARTEEEKARGKEREELVLSIVEKVCSWGNLVGEGNQDNSSSR